MPRSLARAAGLARELPAPASTNNDEYVERIAAKFGVTSRAVSSELEGVAKSTWKLLATVPNPPPWEIFVKKLDHILLSRDSRPRKGPTSRDDAPSFREVQSALNDAVQERSSHDQRGSTRDQSADVESEDLWEEDSRQPDRESPSSRAPTLRTETERGIHFEATAPADTSSPLLVLRRIRDHVEEAAMSMNEVKIPAVIHAESMETIDARLQDWFQRFRLQLTGDDKSITDEIVREGGHLKMLQVNSLRDAENVYEKQTAAVLQTLSDLLITALGPAFIRRSLQKISTQNLEEYIPVDLLNSASPLLENERRRASSGLLHGVSSLPRSWRS